MATTWSKPSRLSNRVAAPTIYLVRHGHTAYNASSTSTGAGSGRIRGWIDIPLDEEGRREAKRTADSLAKIIGSSALNPIILSSDLSRALDTATEIAKVAPNTRVLPTKSLRPWNLGTLQGQDAGEAQKTLVEYATRAPDTPVPGGESFNSFKERYLSLLRLVMEEVESGKPPRIMVTHYRNFRLTRAWLAGSLSVFLQKGNDETGEILRLTLDKTGWKEAS